MFDTLPTSGTAFLAWDWAQIQPFIDELNARELTPNTVEAWLRDWTHLYR